MPAVRKVLVIGAGQPPATDAHLSELDGSCDPHFVAGEWFHLLTGSNGGKQKQPGEAGGPEQ